MARTAPAPNLPPIPGMCPSVAVMGGGGGAGGGSGGSGSGGSGGAQGNGDGSAEDANGDGTNADACGTGGTAGCTNCGSDVSRGDPVDVLSGRVFTVPITDVFLAGPLPFELERAYNSAARIRDVGLGFGWSHSFAWEVVEKREHLEVWTQRGNTMRFDGPIPEGESALGPGGWVLRREKFGYVLIDRFDTCWRVFSAQSPEDPSRYLLTGVQDRNRNQIKLTYEDGHLVDIEDCVGRNIRFRRDARHRATEVQVYNAVGQGTWVTMATYLYDDHGDLVTATDADGHRTRFEYAGHLLTRMVEPTGIRFHYRYDAKARCIETWGDYEGGDPSLAADVPRFLHDHTTRARGVLHCRLEFDDDDNYVEVVDSVQVQRFFGNQFGKIDKGVSGSSVTSRTYDARGHVLTITDPLGAVTKFERDVRGRLLKSTDPLGRVWVYDRDENGRVVRIVDPKGGETRLEYDQPGNLRQLVEPSGNTIVYEYDARGLCTSYVERNGATTRMEYDAHGNRVRVVTPNQGDWKSTYDFFGQRTSATDALGGTTHFAFSPRGDLVRIRHADDAITQYDWDGRGRLLKVTGPTGRIMTCEYGGHDCVTQVTRPDGSVIRMRYNRESWLIELHNENDEVHRIEHDGLGRAIAQTSFDGSVRRYRYDAIGNLTRYENGASEITDYEYDLAGQLTKRALPDGSEEVFEYDALGMVTAASTARSSVTLNRDQMGSIVRDEQRYGDDLHFVENDYGPMGSRSELRTSVGHRMEMLRDSMDWRHTVRLPGSHEVRYERDATGQATNRFLPRGGRVNSEFDVMGRLTRRSVFSSQGGPPSLPPDQPDWVGPIPTPATADVKYRYDETGELLDRWDQDRGSVAYKYDPLGQILAAIPQQGRAEVFRHDRAGNIHEEGEGAPSRSYGAGNRLQRIGDTEYRWDDDGRLVEKRKRSDGGDQVWSYHWNGRGLLAAVACPDGRTVCFEYDAFARRIEKRIVRMDGLDERVEERCRYVWDGEFIAHEIRRVAGESGDAVVEERTFVFEDDGLTPFAQRTVVRQGDERIEKDWLQYVTDAAGTPERLVAPDGSIASEVDATTWGLRSHSDDPTAATPLGFMGQWEDPEIGLFYSRYRYYDPEAARFISYDPVGIEAGPNSFLYAPNPLSWVDPFGLTHYASAALYESEADYRAGEQPIATSRQYDSTMTRHQRARIAAHPEGSAERRSETARMRSRCHTERKVCDPPNGFGRRGPGSMGEGQCMVVTAESVDGSPRRPPCSQCQGAMRRLSRDRQGTVIYRPGMSGRMDRPWICRNGVVQARG